MSEVTQAAAVVKADAVGVVGYLKANWKQLLSSGVAGAVVSLVLKHLL